MMLFALNPAAIFDTVVWGASDSIVALPMIIAAILILTGAIASAGVAAAIAILAKRKRSRYASLACGRCSTRASG